MGDANPQCKAWTPQGSVPCLEPCSPGKAESAQATPHRSFPPELVFYTAGAICAAVGASLPITKRQQQEACEKLKCVKTGQVLGFCFISYAHPATSHLGASPGSCLRLQASVDF